MNLYRYAMFITRLPWVVRRQCFCCQSTNGPILVLV